MRYPERTTTPHTRYAKLPYATIELQSHCNRDCPFCPRFHDRSGERKDADGHSIIERQSSDRIYWLLDELAMGGFVGRVCFHRLSDPLLDKRYAEFAEAAAEKGMKVFDSTNGDVLRNNEALCKRLDGVVDTFYIGIYDYKWARERDEEMAMWRSRFAKTKILFSTPYEEMGPRQFSESYDDLYKDPRVLDLPCPAARDQLRVNYDGDVHLCCQDDYGSFALGNVFEDGIDAVMWSAHRQKIDADLAEKGGRKKYELCAKCYFGGLSTADKTDADKRADLKVSKGLQSLQSRFDSGEINLPTLTKRREDLKRRIYGAPASEE